MRISTPTPYQALAAIGAAAIAYLFIATVLLKPVQYVSLCNAVGTTCTLTEASFSYDSMDGQFVMAKIYHASGQITTFSGTECWVKPEGSSCLDSTTNENKTGSDQVIIPVAYHSYAFRWAKQPLNKN